MITQAVCLMAICGQHVESPSRCSLYRPALPIHNNLDTISHEPKLPPIPYTERSSLIASGHKSSKQHTLTRVSTGMIFLQRSIQLQHVVIILVIGTDYKSLAVKLPPLPNLTPLGCKYSTSDFIQGKRSYFM